MTSEEMTTIAATVGGVLAALFAGWRRMQAKTTARQPVAPVVSGPSPAAPGPEVPLERIAERLDGMGTRLEDHIHDDELALGRIDRRLDQILEHILRGHQ